MAFGTKDLTKIRINAWAKIRWAAGGVLKDLGYTDKPTLKGTPILLAVKTAQTGNLELDHSHLGMNYEIVVPCKQVDRDMLLALCPWAQAGSGGEIPMAPQTLGAGLYQYAQRLNFHPLSAADTVEAEDETMDLNFAKAVPICVPLIERDGTAHDVLPVTFKVYADISYYPLLVYGWVGAVPVAGQS